MPDSLGSDLEGDFAEEALGVRRGVGGDVKGEFEEVVGLQERGEVDFPGV